MPHIFPPHRHIVVIGEKRFPAKILVETPNAFSTPAGLFSKDTRKKFGHPEITFEGPFTAEGDMESLP
ncbi:MAG: hypothetical protein EOS07_22150 [Mesorhizobium sp.]|uniref:hypothetical protein n=1 Tax=Mesorhizobium sp. TaxID=1871066 RepID=UPI000FE75D67|nr:hypothetical protein [Mesorhizobium sp.]RWO06343.1 MAG: hypothetical protein EOS07_22150 [Mesorhizobium sp.]RWP29500.1 MAG: hypothetical protein EOR03_26605 [Mesorhizobium sp.]RWP69514.1 MAG: hypothetical protein EOR07_03035 [Mesorhizobium sp.]